MYKLYLTILSVIYNINQIETNISQFEKGHCIYYNSLPKPIDQEYLYNSSIEKRNSIFQIVISKYTEEKRELEESIKQEILNYKKLDNQEFSKIKKTVMNKLQGEKSKVDKLKKIIELFQDSEFPILFESIFIE